MLTRIIRHEWRNLVADKTLWVVVALFAAVIGYGVYNGAAWVNFQQQSIKAATGEEEKRLAALKAEIVAIEQGTKKPGQFTDPRSPARAGGGLGARYAVMPPAALAPLAVGQSDLYPYYFQVTTRSKQTFLNNEEIENPTNLLAGRFDLAFVVIYLYPLLILAVSYNILSAEREQGTLAMLLSQPVALRQFVLGKVALRALVVLLPALGFSLIGFFASRAELTASALLRLALWAAVVAAYGAFWFALASLVSAWGKSSATNALALAGLWLVFVLIIPALVNVTATTLYPVPSRVEMVQAMRRASKEAAARGSQLLAKYYEDHPELVPAGASPDMNDFFVRSIAVQDDVEQQIQPVLAQFDEQLFRQQRLVDRFRFLSPAILTQSALNDVAGTGPDRYRHFLRLVDDYHQSWLAFFRPRIVRKTQLTAADYEQMPRFTFVEEPTAAVARRVLVGWAGLFIPAVLIGFLAMAALRRYSPAG